MPRSRFVVPRLRTLALTDGLTITVRERLTHGEQQAAYARMYRRGKGSGLRVDPLKVGQSLILAYLVDWNLTDESGSVVPIRGLAVNELADVINALDHETVLEIKRAIEAHELAVKAARDAEKKTDGAMVSVGI